MRGDLKQKRVVLVVGVIVMLAVIGVVVYLTTGQDEDTPDTGDPTVPAISGTTPPAEPPPATTSAPPAPSAPVTSGAGTMTGPPPPTGEDAVAARTVLDDAITAINSQDIGAMVALSCDPETVGQPEDLPTGVTAVLVENPQIDGDKATAKVALTIEGRPEPTVAPLPLEKRADGTWCVA